MKGIFTEVLHVGWVFVLFNEVVLLWEGWCMWYTICRSRHRLRS